MQELDSQTTSLLLLCKASSSSSMPQTPVVGLDSPEVAASKAMGYIAEIKLQRYVTALHDKYSNGMKLTKPAHG